MTRPVPECIFLDLDDTVYPPETGLWGEIGRRINRYLVERMAVPESTVDAVRRRYFETYGTTCNGLRAERHVDPEDFYRFVHDIPLERFLSPDLALRRMLTGLDQRRYIFSNADRTYILRVLSALDIADCFDGIVDIFATGLVPKPEAAAYRCAMQLAGSPPADQCLLADDLPRNLLPARELGWTAVLVHNRPDDGSAHHRIGTIHRLPEVLV
jgi:putative hydrolase of the HAD superfamily